MYQSRTRTPVTIDLKKMATTVHHLLLFFGIAAVVIIHPSSSSAAAAADVVSLAGCEEKCGDITVPYPFGTKQGCYRGGFNLNCNATFNPPKLFLESSKPTAYDYEVTNISISAGQIIVKTQIGRICVPPYASKSTIFADFTGLPYTFSEKRNRFTAIGCAALAINANGSLNVMSSTSGCVTICNSDSTFVNGTCSGIGCCQTSIAQGLKMIAMMVGSYMNNSNAYQISPCSYMFLVDQEEYAFRSTDFFALLSETTAPTVLDWAVGEDKCEVAATTAGSLFACGANSRCVDSTNGPGYRCSCVDGYAGNPYLSDGCQDINECDYPSTNTCSDICTNTLGNYTCSCPDGYYGDGRKTGKGCIRKNVRFPLLQVVLGVGLGSMFLLVGGCWLYWFMKKKRMLALKEKYFKQNGGLVLKQRMSSNSTIAQVIKIFQTEELKKATDNYSEAMVLGGGGQGTVYRGILPDNRVVAIKKSILVSEDQVEDFINEVVILSQTIHRNVVRLLGCCLESEIPMLVYEFIPNGSLHDHIHGDDGHRPTLPWHLRLRIAAETAGAIDYLHTAAAIPIYHRDIKSANILLDKDFAAKVSDFGVSRLVAMDEVQVTTLVRGTLGYLDPVYFQTGQLTDKSDVYSFGVVLVELLTGQETISTDRGEAGRNLAQYFLTATKENRFFEIIDPRISVRRDQERLLAVAEVAKACLRLKTEDRPTMKEVAADLAKLRITMHRENNHNRSRAFEDDENENELKEMNNIIRRLRSEPGASEVFTGTLDDSITLLR